MKYIGILILVIVLVIFTTCKKEAALKPKEYPYVYTNEATEINSSGATLSADLIDYGKEEILDFGFIWSDSRSEYQISLQKKGLGIDDFTYRITSDLEVGINYSCKAYNITNKHVIYGNNIIFTSQGSQLPVVENFFPKQGFDGSTITITGKDFSIIPSKNKVFVNNTPVQIIYSQNDTIVIVTPNTNYYGDADISVEVGSRKVTATNKFKIMGPQILNISTIIGHSGGYITIEGENLTQNGKNIDVYFGTYKAEIIDTSKTKLDFIVPTPWQSLLSDISLPLKLVNGLKTASYNQNFQIVKSWSISNAPPFQTSFQHPMAVSYNNRGYILASKQLYGYDPAMDNWYAISSFPGQFTDYCLFAILGNKLLKIGGYNSTFLTDFWEYDFSSSTWIKKNDIPFTFRTATYFTVENDIYIITDAGQAWKYSSTDAVFTRLNDFPESFNFKSAFAFKCNEKILVVTDKKTWLYDLTNDRWIERATNPNPSKDDGLLLGFSIKNTGYILQNQNSIYKYDYNRNKWIITTTIPGRSWDSPYRVAFAIGDNAYVASTNNYSGLTNLMYYYKE